MKRKIKIFNLYQREIKNEEQKEYTNAAPFRWERHEEMAKRVEKEIEKFINKNKFCILYTTRDSIIIEYIQVDD